MYKKILIPIVLTVTTFSAFAQTNPQIERALSDPKRAENAAKADVYRHRKPVISDSIETTDTTINTTTQKKQSCKRKTPHI